MVSQPIDSEPITLHKFFNEHPRLRVPEFQRTYVWRTSPNTELPRFWNDLSGLWDGDGGAPLFLGAIVLHETKSGGFQAPDEYDIIDGQQRLLTLYLFLTAIAEAFQDAGDTGSATNLQQQYLLMQLSGFSKQPQFISAIHDSNQFNQAVLSLRHPIPQVPRGYGSKNGRLSEAWIWIRRRVREFAGDPREESGLSCAKLSDLQAKLVAQTHLVVIRVFDKATAHQVFERLNKGGKPLDDIDLVRNLVFGTLSATSPEEGGAFYNASWDPFEQKLGKHAKEYWYPLALIRDEKATKAGAYTALQTYWLKEAFTDGQTGSQLAQKIMSDLGEYIHPFQAITGIDVPTELLAAERIALSRLHRAEVPVMTYGFFMQLIQARLQESVTSTDFLLFCEIVETAIARRVLQGIEMNAFFQAFKGAWQNHNTPAALLAHLTDKLKLGNDDDLRQGILTANLGLMKRCRFILTEHERWDPKGAKHLPTDTEAFHVDHVLPQKFVAKDWPDVSSADHQQLIHTWGNLAMMTPTQNIAKSAKEYAKVRPDLAEPGGVPFRTTGELVKQHQSWDAHTIRVRAGQLTEWAIERWPLTLEGFQDTERAKRLVAAG